MEHSLATGCTMLGSMRHIAVFIGASLAIFSCRESCSPSEPLLGEIPSWRMIVTVVVSLTAGAVAAWRYA